MRILFLIRSLAIGGAERQLVNLATGMSAEGHEVSVIVFYPGGEFEADLQRANVPVITVGKRSRWDVVGFLRRLVREVRARKPEIVHGYMPAGNLAASLVSIFVPTVRIVWGIRAANMDLTHFGFFARLVDVVHRGVARSADLVITNSAAAAEQFRARARRVAVVHNGIDTRSLRPLSAKKTELRDRLGLAPETPLYGIVGRLDPMKDHVTFFRVASLLSRIHPSARFVVVGDGSEAYRKQLETAAETCGVKDLTFWVPASRQPADIYNGIDVLICCSIAESFPNVVAEAMACGSPAVVTRVGEAPQIVLRSEYVTEPKDVEAIAAAAHSAWLHRSGEMAAELHASIHSRFGMEKLVRSTVALLEAL
jgi:glycosyltransferase involved in cell wall biosynthesis